MMDYRAWIAACDPSEPGPGATEKQLEYLIASIREPLSPSELDYLAKREEWLARLDQPGSHRWDPLSWVPSTLPLPEDFLDFLRVSNGGKFHHGRMVLWICDHRQVRSVMLSQSFNVYLPHHIPYGHDEEDGWYSIDLSTGGVCFAPSDMTHTPMPLAATFRESLTFTESTMDRYFAWWRSFNKPVYEQRS